MNEYLALHSLRLSGKVLLAFILTTFFTATAVDAQTTDDAAMQQRVARARALAAAHNLQAAAAELETVRHQATDETLREGVRVMLMGIHLEQGDYARAESLLEETFKARSGQNESSKSSYFALAGQTLNGARAHLDRYRTFGINLADKELPQEALNDIDRLRVLLERIAQQAREISNEDAKSIDAAALMEDVANVRSTLARDDEDRLKWERELSDARQRLTASQTRVAAVRLVPTSRTTQPATANTGRPGSSPTQATPRSSSTGPSNTPAKEAASPASASSKPSSAPADASPNAPQNENGTAPAAQPIEVGSLLEMATQKVKPLYPMAAKSARITGVVTVHLVVDEKGSVAAIQRASGPQLLQQAATEAARRWKFRPTLIAGQPVRVMGYINFNFAL